jgi:D-alanyl-D-alanine carboxypeptidase
MRRRTRAVCGHFAAAAAAMGLGASVLLIMGPACAQAAHQGRADAPPVNAGSHGDDAALGAAATAIQRVLALSSAPGVVVGITDRAKTQKVIVSGYADLKKRTPLTAGSRFAIGSISKSFTSVALMELADEGRFQPQAPITRYLPEFKLESRYPPITGRHVLSHTSGLPNYFEDAASSRYALVKLQRFSPAYPPGAHWWYSNTGFQILGYAIESIERSPYATVIQHRVLDPLGMRSTIPVIDDAHRQAMTVSYEHWPYDGSYVEASWFEYSASDGSIVSDAPDMCAYLRFYLNRGTTPQGRVLSEKSFDELTTPVLNDYAYGLFVRHQDGDTVIGHDGAIAGFRAHIEAHMNDGFGIVILTNGGLADGHTLAEWIGHVVTAAYRGQALPPAPAITATPALKEYAGLYHAHNAGGGSAGNTLEVFMVGDRLMLKHAGGNRVLERMGANVFREAGPGGDNLPFFFFRSGDGKAGTVTDVSHGAAWYAGKEFSGTVAAAAPSAYAAYVGHYAHHGPEGPAARVFVRNGALMIAPSGTDGPPEAPEPLVPVGEEAFRPGKAEVAYNPERMRFDTLEDGRTLRLTITGVPLYRMETP